MPTWTPEPVTPTPTATPTATPTPIIYAIQSGDTILDIAKRFNVSAVEIQEVNGITDPRLLQIGQEIVIPPQNEAGVMATPTPTPMPLHVISVTHAKTTIGEAVILGELVNDNPTAVEEVVIQVELHDENGHALITAEATALLDVIPAGAKAPFGVTIQDAPDYSSVVCRVLRAKPEVPERAAYHDFAVAEVSGRAAYDKTFSLVGKVRNTGEETATEVFVVVTLYGRDGRIVGAKREPLPDAIEPWYDHLFQITMVPLAWPVENYEVAIEGRKMLETPTATPEITPGTD